MFCRCWKGAVGVVSLVLILLLVLAGSFFHVTDNYGLDTLDWRFRLRPNIPASADLVIIEIGDDTIQKLGRFPFDRSYHAVLIKALSEFGARAVLFDVFFSEPAPGDEELRDAIHAAGNVYLPYVLNLRSQKGTETVADGFTAQSLPALTRSAKGTGHINVVPDLDGKFRRVPVFIREGERLRPYLSFLLGCDYLGIPPDTVTFVPGKEIRCGPNLRVPLDQNSNLIVNFSGPWGRAYRHVSYVDVLQSYLAGMSGQEPQLDLNLVRNKVCMVGLTAAGTTDLHPNSYEALYPAVGMHADVFNSMITGNFIRRAPRSVNMAVLLALMLLISLAACRTKPLKGGCILLGTIAVFVGVCVLLFNFAGVWLDMFYPVLIMGLSYLACTLSKYFIEWKKRLVYENELQIAKRIQESFLPKEVPARPGVDVAATMFTARQVGGDLYDFLEFGEDKIGVMIGDVSGKGIPASLFMAMVSGSFKFYAMPEVSPRETLSRLNAKIIRESSSNLFVTVFYAVFDVPAKTVTFASGGHLPLLCLPAQGPSRFLDVEEGCPLGMVEGPYSGGKSPYARGDVFIFYTDGITEARDTGGQMYGTGRLVAVAEKNRRGSAAEILAAVEKDVRRFEPQNRQQDDITVIVVRIV